VDISVDEIKMGGATIQCPQNTPEC